MVRLTIAGAAVMRETECAASAEQNRVLAPPFAQRLAADQAHG